MSKTVRPGGNTDWVIYVLVGVAGLAGLVWVISSAVAWVTGQRFEGGLIGGMKYSFQHPFAVYGVLLVLLVIAGVVSGKLWTKGKPKRLKTEFRTLPGMGSAADVIGIGGKKQVLSSAGSLRPSVEKPTIKDVGFFEGSISGVELYSKVEDSTLIIGPPRSGKGFHLVIPRILDSPGAVVTTSTRPDNLAVTMEARSSGGRPVVVFDPEGMAPGVVAGMRWSPVRGCEDPRTAAVRAAGLAASGFAAGGENKMWQDLAASALKDLLHAAALEGLGAKEVYEWSLSPVKSGGAIDILTSHPRAVPGWGEDLSSAVNADPRTRDSIWMGVRQSLASLADPRVLEAVSPGPGEGLDPAELLRNKGTLYMIGTAQGAVTSAGLITALIEDIVQTAKIMAAASPRARLDPPLSLVLDEAANYPLPSLGALMSEGGGSGIATMAVVQSLAQARDKWGADQAQAIWDSATVKHVLGGSANSETLRDISALIGERDEITMSANMDRSSWFMPSSTSQSVRRIPIMTPEQVRELPFGLGLLMLRSAPPVIVDHQPWLARREGKELDHQRNVVEQKIQEAFAYANPQ